MTALPRPAARPPRTARPAGPARNPRRAPAAHSARTDRPTRTSASAAPRLQVVSTRDAAEHTGVGFVGLCVVLLVGGLLALLLINTNRAQESFAIQKLQTRSAALTDQQQGLSSEIDSQSAPQQLAIKAQALGLAPARQIRYVGPDGKQIGASKRANLGTTSTVNTLPSTPDSRVADRTVGAAAPGVLVKRATPKKKAPAKAKKDSPAASSKAHGASKTGGTRHKATPTTGASADAAKKHARKAKPTRTGSAKHSSTPTK